jgi:hypothetical protein
MGWGMDPSSNADENASLRPSDFSPRRCLDS